VDTRQSKLLAAIIDQFIQTALPVGSKQLLSHCTDFCLSGATIRNEMRVLGDEGFLDQPHISAGRIPTAKGYRLYVKQYLDPTAQEKVVKKKFETLKDQYFKRKDQERAYEAVALLSQMVPNIAFATVPHKPGVYFLGLANALRQIEFQQNPGLASAVVEVLEERITDVLKKIDVDDTVQYYIGEEHILPQFQSCSLMITGYGLRGHTGVIGILGHMRMDYAYNTVALELVADLLRSAS
jgi:transcriptional regulator of heat shock response